MIAVPRTVSVANTVPTRPGDTRAKEGATTFDLQTRVGPFDTALDRAFVRGYLSAVLAATSHVDPHRDAAPPAAIATRVFEAQFAGITQLVPPPVWDSMRGGVHGEHDLVLRRPIRPGEPLSTLVGIHSVRPLRHNARIVLRHETVDAGGDLVAEQLWTTVLIGATCDASGPELPAHSFERGDRVPAAQRQVHIDAQMARDYAAVSGDHSAHHFEAEAAQRSGYEEPFLHGMCTLGVCTEAAVDALAGGDPAQIGRVAVRFASPVFFERELTVSFYDVGGAAFAFEARCDGARVISNGRVELRSGPG